MIAKYGKMFRTDRAVIKLRFLFYKHVASWAATPVHRVLVWVLRADIRICGNQLPEFIHIYTAFYKKHLQGT